jgi:DedD protein
MDIALKQRLVGASVLIALAVVVLPMLLGGRPEIGAPETQRIELPPQPPELDFESRRYPIGEAPPPRQAKSTEQAVKPLPSPGTSTRKEQPVQSPPPEQAPTDTAATRQEEQATTAIPGEGVAATPPAVKTPATMLHSETNPEEGGRYVVQIASFGAVENANRLSETLSGYGYQVMLDSVKSDVGTLHRVRIGPFPTEAAANETVSRLRSQIGDVKPRVLDLQPDKASQVTRPSDPLVRWVVQVGSFSSSSNADKLVARLRLESLSAFREEVKSSGSTIYRVRIGPFVEREEAIRIDKLVKQRLSLDGVVMSAN